VRALLLAGGVASAGCSRPPEILPLPPAAAPSACVVASDSIGTARSVSAAYEDSSDAERARRAASVEPPIRLDCDGRQSPGLAAAWSRDTSGRYWTLELVSPDSTASLRWTAGALVSTWRADPGARAALRWSGIESLAPIDDRRLVVGFTTPHPEPPAVFGDLALGVAPNDSSFAAVAPTAVIADLRDAVDRGPDVIVARDPALLDYARRRPGLAARPLPWSRTYLLLLPAGATGDLGLPVDTAGFRAELARDVVPQEARPAKAGGWWEARAACPGRVALPSGRSPDDRVVYPAGDRVARALAERLVALASGPTVIARGLTPDSLAGTLRSGGARAFVVGVPTRELVPCRQTAAWPDSATVLPLVETRAQALIRRGAPALVSDYDGTLRMERP
jgi:hypothetical protein